MRRFPIALAAAAGIFTGLMSAFGGVSLILLGLRELAFSVFAFLVLIAAFNDLTSGQSSLIRKALDKIKSFLTEEEIYFGVKSTEYLQKIKARFVQTFSAKPALGETVEVQRAHAPETASGLVEIQKDKEQNGIKPEDNKHTSRLSVLYIVSFAGIALWRITRMFAVVPLSYIEDYNYSIIHALVLLFVYCIMVIYLKLSKTESADKTSRQMLALLGFVFLIYAAVIGINSVLNIDILAVLQWVFYAASIYLIGALAINILLSVFRNDILKSFDYTIIPKNLKLNTDSFLDSQDVKINFSIKSLYTFKYTLKIIPAVFLALGFILLLSTTVFIVQPHQQAAVYRLGKLSPASIAGEGIHFKLPWPVDRVEVYDVRRINSLQIGYQPFDFDGGMYFMWEFGGGVEHLLLLGNGNELIAFNMKINYYISDLYSYITTSANPQAVLSAAAYQALMNRTVYTTLDTFLSVDRDLLSISLLNELSDFSMRNNLGLSVVQIIIESIHPPLEVADIYQRVVTASVDKNTIVTNAKAHAERILIEAERQSITAANTAMAEQFNRVSAAQNEMAVYNAAMEAYRINPASFMLSKYLHTFEKVIGGMRVFVFSPGTEDSIPNSFIGSANVNIWNRGSYE
jgi:membrane protease subunit HflK